VTIHAKASPPGGEGDALALSFPGGNGNQPSTPPAKTQVKNPRAVCEARRQLNLEFLYECAGGVAVHAALVQTFAEIGDTAGACYAMRRLLAHAKAAHPVYVELRDGAASGEGCQS
jgi:hypothetical protein